MMKLWSRGPAILNKKQCRRPAEINLSTCFVLPLTCSWQATKAIHQLIGTQILEPDCFVTHRCSNSLEALVILQ